MSMGVKEIRERLGPLLAEPSQHLGEIRSLLSAAEGPDPSRDWMVRRFRAEHMPGIEPVWEEAAAAVAPLATHQDVQLRRTALGVLAYAPAEASRAAFAKALSDSDETARYNALNGLVDHAAPGTAELLLERLHDPDPFMRMYAAAGLGQLRVERARAPLEQALAGERSPFVRGWMLIALAEVAGPAVLESLLARLLDPGTGDMDMQGVYKALAAIGGPAVEPLREALGRQPDGSGRRRLLEALVRLGADVGESDLSDWLDEAASPEDRLWAASLLAQSGRSRGVDLLRELAHGPDPEVAGAAARVLLAAGDEGGLELALAHYFDPPPLRRRIRAQLAELPQALRSHLVALLTQADASASVRAAAADLVGRHGVADAEATLVGLVGEEPRLALAAVTALFRLGSERARAALEAEMTRRPNAFERWRWLGDLAHLERPIPLALIDRLLVDPAAPICTLGLGLAASHGTTEAEQRVTAWLGIAYRRLTGEMPPLDPAPHADFLGQPSYEEALLLADGLFRAGLPPEVAAEIERLDRAGWRDPNKTVAMGALAAAAEAELQSAVDIVDAFADLPDDTIRCRALRALLQLAPADLSARVARLADDANPAIRHLARA